MVVRSSSTEPTTPEASTSTAPPDDPLRLRNCPNCEYSLETLPKAGICPECGTAFDRRSRIASMKASKPSKASDSALPAVGSVAPKFALPASNGKTIALADFAGKRAVVLYFYPKADTPGCTKQACGFRDALADFDKAKLVVLGISPDPVEAVTKFAAKFELNFPLLADADHAVAEKYGVWGEKSMYGKKYMGVMRTTFVIDRFGKVAHVFEKVKPEGHDREVLEWVKANLE